jgi:tetratricopeptide (TPR) repeat protein
MRILRKCLVLFFLPAILLAPLVMSSQPFYELSDFLAMAGNSPKKYDFTLLQDRIKDQVDHGNLNFNYYYQSDSAGKRVVYPWILAPEIWELQEWALEALDQEMPDTAISIYEEILEKQPGYSPALVGIGMAWHSMENYPLAVQFFRQAITENPIDYTAFWSLARTYEVMKISDSAQIAIIRAWILNRNSIEISKDAERICSSSGGDFKHWNFTPQYKISTREDRVVVQYQRSWMGYAICKALWAYEPDFSSKREIPGSVTMFQERECLSCLLTSMEADKKEYASDQALQGFKLALQHKMAMEFILFEILLPANPDMAYLLDDARIAGLVDYVKLTRLK